MRSALLTFKLISMARDVLQRALWRPGTDCSSIQQIDVTPLTVVIITARVVSSNCHLLCTTHSAELFMGKHCKQILVLSCAVDEETVTRGAQGS